MDALRRAEEAKRLGQPGRQPDPERIARRTDPGPAGNDARPTRPEDCRRSPGGLDCATRTWHPQPPDAPPDKSCPRPGELRADFQQSARPMNAARRETSLPSSRRPGRAPRCGFFWDWEASRRWRSAVISGGSCSRFPAARWSCTDRRRSPPASGACNAASPALGRAANSARTIADQYAAGFRRGLQKFAASYRQRARPPQKRGNGRRRQSDFRIPQRPLPRRRSAPPETLRPRAAAGGLPTQYQRQAAGARPGLRSLAG
jgi:hypothetical protein